MSEEVDKLKLERDKANQETKATAQKNRQALQEFKALIDCAGKEKEARNKANAEVARLKVALGEAEKKAKACREGLDCQSAKLDGIPSKDNPLKIQQEIDELEWIQQTEATPEQEKQLAKKIRELRRRLPQAQEFVETINGYKKARDELRTANGEARKLREQLGGFVAESEKHHRAMMESYDRADALRKKIGETFKELDEKRDKADEFHKQFLEAREQIRASEEHEKQRDRKYMQVQTEKMKKKISQKAQVILEQFKSGKTISLEEIMILRESGIDLAKK